MANQTYIDGIGEVRLTEGIVRMDLLALSPTQRDDDGRPVPEFVKQIVMSPQGFMRMVQALRSTLQQMQEKGILSVGDRTESKEDAPPTAAETGKGNGGSKPAASPNF